MPDPRPDAVDTFDTAAPLDAVAGGVAAVPSTPHIPTPDALEPSDVPGELPVAGRARRRPRPVFLLVGVVLAAALAVGLFTGVGTPSHSSSPVAGSPVPSFSLPKLGGGGTVAVPAAGGGNGKPAILLFFASWCGPCQAEVPAIAHTYHLQQKEGSPLAKVALLGVDASDPTGNALRFVHKSGVTFPVGADKDFALTEGVFDFGGLPESVFVRADGTIAAIHLGALSNADFVSWEHKLAASA